MGKDGTTRTSTVYADLPNGYTRPPMNDKGTQIASFSWTEAGGKVDSTTMYVCSLDHKNVANLRVEHFQHSSMHTLQDTLGMEPFQLSTKPESQYVPQQAPLTFLFHPMQPQLNTT